MQPNLRGPSILGGGFMALVVVAIAIFLFSYFMPYDRGTQAHVIVKPGMTIRQVAHNLKEAGVIHSKPFFLILAKTLFRHNTYIAGEYQFSESYAVRDVFRKLYQGDVVIRKLVIPEGLTRYEVLQLIQGAAGVEVQDLDITTYPEGSLYPETYYYTYGVTSKELLDKMHQYMQDTLDPLWENRQLSLPFNTKTEALALASIVEKETALQEERGRVAAVFINRLRKNMPLQADPTVIYAITEGKTAFARKLLSKDLKFDSDFNTYQRRGLPPHAIANPGRASIEAVLMPPVTDEYYFVADGHGGHRFASTLKEHQENVRYYRSKPRP